MTRIVKSVCQMCYFNCGIDIKVEDGRIRTVEGMPEHPVSRGRICAKGIASAQLTTDPARLQHPLKRVGERGSGQWERISWEQAFSEIAARLQTVIERSGPRAVGYYRGAAPGWVTNYNYVTRFMNSLGSPNILTHAHLCFTPRAIAHASTFGPFPEPDYERANSIFMIGYNPAYTSPVNYMGRLINAKARGAKLIVADPRFTNTAAKADLFLQPRPGTDAAMVLAMIHVLIREVLYDREFVEKWTTGFAELQEHVATMTPEWAEAICGVPAGKIEAAARLLATVKPALVVDGNGLDQHTNVVQTVRTTSILRSLLGTLDVPGGSIAVPPLPFVDVQLRGKALREVASIMKYPLYWAASDAGNGAELLDSVETEEPYALEALIVQGGDPVSVWSETRHTREVLQKLDLLVVHELYPTSVAQVADYVLPAASFLERDLILYYRYRPYADGNLITAQNKAVEPLGESRSDMDFVFGLARAMGLGEWFPWGSVDEAFDAELEPHGITVAWLRAHPGGYERRYTPEELYRKYEHRGFPTKSGKVELWSSRFADRGYDPLPKFEEPAVSPRSRADLLEKYPLIGATGLKLGIHTHTQFRTLPWIRAIEPDSFVEIHPQTAAALQVSDGEMVLVGTPQGEIRLKARLTEVIGPGVVMMPHGWGQPYAGGPLSNDITANGPRDQISGATGNRSFLCYVHKESPVSAA
jgi:anaerobic selenocysteine-containing dehydrogenase